MINELKKQAVSHIEDHKEETLQLGDTLFNNPELGFREFRTGEIIRDYLRSHGLKIDRTFA